MKKIISTLLVLLLIGNVAFAQKKDKKNNNKSLVGVNWVLKTIEKENAPESTKTAYILFGEGDRMSGCLGCNQFFGTYTFSKKKISIDYAGSTKMMCLNNETEQQFSKALKKEIRYFSIQKNVLTLLDRKKNSILTFEAVDAIPEVKLD
ncbi:MAG: META domain-containing protein [Bacteroidales bacterium]|jgi:putative lipoprotein|nr:META domain-containing protein [Bacteroidales bacterium]